MADRPPLEDEEVREGHFGTVTSKLKWEGRMEMNKGKNWEKNVLGHRALADLYTSAFDSSGLSPNNHRIK